MKHHSSAFAFSDNQLLRYCAISLFNSKFFLTSYLSDRFSLCLINSHLRSYKLVEDIRIIFVDE